jgi:hypothetical protein
MRAFRTGWSPPEKESAPPTAIGETEKQKICSTKHSSDRRIYQHRFSLTNDPRACRLAERVHSLGVRPFLELLCEIGEPEDVLIALERFSKLNPEIVRALGADRLPAPALLKVG